MPKKSTRIGDDSEFIAKLREDNLNSYKGWRERERRYRASGRSADVLNYCKARAYVSTDGFYEYCTDILGYKDLYIPFHRPMCEHVADTKPRYKMIQACRGSFKSSVCTIGYTTWRLAQEYTLTGACNLQILIASEVLALANAFVSAIRVVMEQNEQYRELFGDHKGPKRDKKWSDTSITSRFRTILTAHSPTVSALALDAPRAGFHYDIIIADDLETERSSATRDQIEKVWSFYQLIHSLLGADVDPKGELVLVSTRWHYNDIYQRILEATEDEIGAERYSVMIKPAEDKDGNLSFPTKFNRKHLDHLRKRHGNYHYSCQFLLDPVPEEDRVFKKAWLKTSNPSDYTKRGMRCFLGSDLAYTEQYRLDSGEIRRADWTVIMAVLVDRDWNFIIKDVFRDRCSKREAIKQMYDMFVRNECIQLGLQKFDRSQIEESLVQYGYEVGRIINYEFVTYPAKQSKNDRIITALQPLVEAGKLSLLPGVDWLEEEFLDFPRAATDDGLDALCNIVKISRPAPGYKPKKRETWAEKHIRELQSGTFDPDGENVDWRNY